MHTDVCVDGVVCLCELHVCMCVGLWLCVLTDRYHLLALAPAVGAEGAGGPGEDGRGPAMTLLL